jgi:hypothetical protein
MRAVVNKKPGTVYSRRSRKINFLALYRVVCF